MQQTTYKTTFIPTPALARLLGRKEDDRQRAIDIADDVNRRAAARGHSEPVSVEAVLKLLTWHRWQCRECDCFDSPANPLTLVHPLPLGEGRVGLHHPANLSPRCWRCAGRKPKDNVVSLPWLKSGKSAKLRVRPRLVA